MEGVKREWDRVVELVGERSKPLGAFLAEGVPTDLRDKTLTVTFARDNGFHADKISRDRGVVEEVLQQVFREELELECVVDPSRTSGRGKKTGALERAEGKEPRQNPLVRLVLEAFDGELIED